MWWCTSNFADCLSVWRLLTPSKVNSPWFQLESNPNCNFDTPNLMSIWPISHISRQSKAQLKLTRTRSTHQIVSINFASIILDLQYRPYCRPNMMLVRCWVCRNGMIGQLSIAPCCLLLPLELFVNRVKFSAHANQIYHSANSLCSLLQCNLSGKWESAKC